MSKYYDGTKLLSLNDINGEKPELYICCGNRTAGKSVYFNRLLANKWLKKKEMIGILYRFKYEAINIADSFWGDIGKLFFKNHEFKGKVQEKGTYVELYMDDELCGYALCINGADRIKKLSHIFNEIKWLLLDEFQNETSTYCNREIEKFQSIHTSLARGNGEQVRYLPTFLVGNSVTLLNPYYVALDISQKLQNNTNYLRGNGYVLEQTLNKNASEAQMKSAFNRAFGNTGYTAYSAQNIYLNDTMTLIANPSGNNVYVATLIYKGKEYCVREYLEDGVIFCGKNVDSTYPYKIAVTTDDMDINYIMLKNSEMLLSRFKYYFNKGCFRFKDLMCKEVVLKMLSY